MPTITNANNSAHQETSRLSYIASGPFKDHFFNYSAKSAKPADYNPIGSLTPVTSDPGLCPAGSILRETGRKLYPGVNPGIDTLMVMVFDSQTLLKGYINPTLPIFSIFSTDKQYFIPNSKEPVIEEQHILSTNLILATEELGYISPVNSVQQLTNKTTSVRLNGVTGKIITAADSIAAGALVTFQLNNTSIAATDFMMMNQLDYIGDMGNYTLNFKCHNGYADIHIKNITSQPIATNIVIQFVIIKIVVPVL